MSVGSWMNEPKEASFQKKYEEIGEVRRPQACRKRIIMLTRAGVTSANLHEPRVAAMRSCSTVKSCAYRKPTLLAPVRYSVASHCESAGTPVTRECLSNVHRSVRQGKAWQPPQYRILVSTAIPSGGINEFSECTNVDLERSTVDAWKIDSIHENCSRLTILARKS